MFLVRVETGFSSSHYLKEYDGDCANLHGHNWKVIVELKGNDINGSGMLVDFKILKKEVEKVAGEFDHTVINNHPYFKEKNPTAENIAKYFYKQLKNKFQPCLVASIQVFETEKYVATYIPD
jgi:6-pyruvoyltetrahydropterin/6-carboxytetrahydropterin synthase